ncbi:MULTISPECIES: hypothetical protein [Sphingobacterium]|uniref:hypothetical protein n=1 Tax=Sphingobacterium TaxID=28453 RepID=UPI0013DA5A45|nr:MULTISPECIES: hypothetical protein [unclassified Sphingobacterium]
MAWFEFTGSNPTLPSHYTLVVSEPTNCLGTPQSICAIQALNDGAGNPDITNALQNEMIIALNAGTPSTNVKLKAR